ncbi:SGNH/GDSL hydrolase family protein [Paraburkholderia caballeronis]|uniref:SGNH/GDSL hydrolase family protein n=1 Tax=Paraburkholderia caballeronis TaxID=416943 RepID=UPI0010654B59|nr:SGNH/GDSL hydrolase family protein [Paraburkholderia caballeronis]
MTIAFVHDSTGWGVDIDDTGNEQQAPGIGNGIAGRANPTPVQYLQSRADSASGPGVAGIIDLSIPGSTLPSMLNGTPPSIAPLATQLAELPVHADVVLIGQQINDQYVLNESVAQYTAYIQQAIAVVVQYGAIPVYMEPNPISRSDANYAQTNAMVYAADTAFANAGFPVLGNLSEWENNTAPPSASPWNIAWMSSDGVHPNDAGYAVKASNYWSGAPSMMGTTTSLQSVINGVLSGINP